MILDRSWLFARRLLLRTGDALYRNLSLCQGGPAWESHFRKVDLDRGLTCAGYGSYLVAQRLSISDG
jgi:hypothetical protein